jgi:hypothetical protein
LGNSQQARRGTAETGRRDATGQAGVEAGKANISLGIVELLNAVAKIGNVVDGPVRNVEVASSTSLTHGASETHVITGRTSSNAIIVISSDAATVGSSPPVVGR